MNEEDLGSGRLYLFWVLKATTAARDEAEEDQEVAALASLKGLDVRAALRVLADCPDALPTQKEVVWTCESGVWTEIVIHAAKVAILARCSVLLKAGEEG